MIVQTHFPQKLSLKRYDQYLASGWFRGSVMLYKMDVLCLESDLYSVVNIRLNLNKHELKRSLKKIQRRGLAKFKVEIGPVNITEEKEHLYALQKTKFQGFVHNSLFDFLFSGFRYSVFNTHEVCVYDGERLVACSYFDVGETSMASLLGIYDPEYASYSPGIFTMLIEVAYGKQHDYKWYYPGYILNEDKGFEYKLRLGDYEYYNAQNRWASIKHFNKNEVLAHEAKTKHNELEEAFSESSISFRKWTYPYFGIGYMQIADLDFLKLPIVYEIARSTNQMSLFIGYDLDTGSYKIVWCKHEKDHEHMVNMGLSDSMMNNENILLKLYSLVDLILETQHVNDIINYLNEDIK